MWSWVSLAVLATVRTIGKPAERLYTLLCQRWAQGFHHSDVVTEGVILGFSKCTLSQVAIQSTISTFTPKCFFFNACVCVCACLCTGIYREKQKNKWIGEKRKETTNVTKVTVGNLGEAILNPFSWSLINAKREKQCLFLNILTDTPNTQVLTLRRILHHSSLATGKFSIQIFSLCAPLFHPRICVLLLLSVLLP